MASPVVAKQNYLLFWTNVGNQVVQLFNDTVKTRGFKLGYFALIPGQGKADAPKLCLKGINLLVPNIKAIGPAVD